ncbi:MAG TPA: hypothetical protein VGU02_10995 [Gaiellaceae bacterium]|nr:hypothetical protein [Gaiellaceae bacterium]
MIAYTGPFWPLFLHVLGAMVLFGAVLAALIAIAAGHRAAGFKALLIAVPAWVLMRGGAEWTYSHGYSAVKDQTWLKLGMNVADGGLIVLLLALGAAYWSQRTSNPRASRTAAALCAVYLALLAVAWLAMTGKWG